MMEPGHVNSHGLCNADTRHRPWLAECLGGCCPSDTPARELKTCMATPCGCVAPWDPWGILTNGLQDQCVGCHSLPVQAHHCPDHPVPEANAEFAILVPTCSKG